MTYCVATLSCQYPNIVPLNSILGQVQPAPTAVTSGGEEGEDGSAAAAAVPNAANAAMFAAMAQNPMFIQQMYQQQMAAFAQQMGAMQQQMGAVGAPEDAKSDEPVDGADV